MHSLNDLKSRGFLPTDDSPKYLYTTHGEEKGAKYKFASCTGKILAIRSVLLLLLLLLLTVILKLFARHNKEFVSIVSSGQECGLLMDKTAFYAEQVGDWTSGHLDL